MYVGQELNGCQAGRQRNSFDLSRDSSQKHTGAHVDENESSESQLKESETDIEGENERKRKCVCVCVCVEEYGCVGADQRYSANS